MAAPLSSASLGTAAQFGAVSLSIILGIAALWSVRVRNRLEAEGEDARHLLLIAVVLGLLSNLLLLVVLIDLVL
jgi:hypothetical protein